MKTSLFVFIAAQLLLVNYSFKKTIPFEIQSLLGADNPVRVQYESDLKAFNDEGANWILIEKTSPFSVEDLEKVSQHITRALEMNYGAEGVVSPTTAKFFAFDKNGVQMVPFIKDQNWSSGAEKELQDPLWKNQLIHENRKAFLINFKTTSILPRNEEQHIFNRIREELKQISTKRPDLTASLLGPKSASAYFLEEMQLQQRVITPLLILVIIIFFFFCFRSWQVILWSLFTMFITYSSTLVLIIFVEGGLGPYSSFALMFSFIVATSDLIHFFGRYQHLTGPPEDRLKETLQIAWLPCLLTSLTTAAGFIALVLNQNLPVRYFGLYCAFACMIEWFLIFHILPTFLRAFGLKFNERPFDSENVARVLNEILKKYTATIIISSAVALILGIYFTTHLGIDDNFYTKFKNSHPLSKTLVRFSKSFDFVGSISLVIKPLAPPTDLFNNQLSADFRRIETTLENHPEVSRISSLRFIYENLHGKTMSTLKNKAAAQSEDQSILQLLNNYGIITDFYNERSGEYRTTIFLRSLSTQSLDPVLKLIDELATKEKGSYAIRASGFSVIRSYINGKVIEDFVESFFLSAFLIFLCFLILYRNIKWSLLALVPNLVPLISVSGLMGLFNVPVDTNLVILTCVAFGISGDNTLHLSYVIQQQQKRGKTYLEGLKYAFHLIGIAMFATNAVFIFCLPVFLIGNLRLFEHIAVFLSIAFLFAFISDVFVFPALQNRYGWSVSPFSKIEKE